MGMACAASAECWGDLCRDWGAAGYNWLGDTGVAVTLVGKFNFISLLVSLDPAPIADVA